MKKEIKEYLCRLSNQINLPNGWYGEIDIAYEMLANYIRGLQGKFIFLGKLNQELEEIPVQFHRDVAFLVILRKSKNSELKNYVYKQVEKDFREINNFYTPRFPKEN